MGERFIVIFRQNGEDSMALYNYQGGYSEQSFPLMRKLMSLAKEISCCRHDRASLAYMLQNNLPWSGALPDSCTGETDFDLPVTGDYRRNVIMTRQEDFLEEACDEYATIDLDEEKVNLEGIVWNYDVEDTDDAESLPSTKLCATGWKTYDEAREFLDMMESNKAVRHGNIVYRLVE